MKRVERISRFAELRITYATAAKSHLSPRQVENRRKSSGQRIFVRGHWFIKVHKMRGFD
jgi:hypothetical protein